MTSAGAARPVARDSGPPGFIGRLGARIKRFDRDRWKAFFRYLSQRFWDDNCFQYAGALSYTTIFAMVPLTVVVFGIMSGFPVFAEWSDRLRYYIFTNFMPAAGESIEAYLVEFSTNASRLTGVGIVFLLVSALLMMYSIEDAFNRIFRVTRHRRTVARIVVYWTVLSLGPMLVVGGLAMSTYLFTLPVVVDFDPGYRFSDRLLVLVPGAVTWLALTLSYAIVPYTNVPWRNAAIGALVATVLFELSKRGFALYLSNVPTYERIYGAFAVLPIFLIWIYLSWNIVLLGASLAAVLSSFRYHTEERKLPTGHEFAAVLRLLEVLAAAHAHGRGLGLEALHDRVAGLSDEQLLRCLADLEGLRIVERTSLGQWRIIRDLEQVQLADIYEAGGYRIPMTRRGGTPDGADLALAQGATGLEPVLTATVASYLRQLQNKDD